MDIHPIAGLLCLGGSILDQQLVPEPRVEQLLAARPGPVLQLHQQREDLVHVPRVYLQPLQTLLRRQLGLVQLLQGVP